MVGEDIQEERTSPRGKVLLVAHEIESTSAWRSFETSVRCRSKPSVTRTQGTCQILNLTANKRLIRMTPVVTLPCRYNSSSNILLRLFFPKPLHPLHTHLVKPHTALLPVPRPNMHNPALPVHKIGPLTKAPILLELRQVDQMRQRAIQDMRQSGDTLHVAQQAVPVAGVPAGDG